jgi:hypothetical protein
MHSVTHLASLTSPPQASYINNSGGYRPDPVGEPITIPCNTIEVSSAFTATGWSKNLTIPWTVLTQKPNRPEHYRIQFYRMDYTAEHSASALTPMAWSVPSCDGVKQCNPEHIPKYFGVAKLV